MTSKMTFLFAFTARTVIFDDYEAVRDMLTSDLWADRYVDSWILERSFGKELGKQESESFYIVSLLPCTFLDFRYSYLHLGIFFGNGESWKELRRFSLRTLRDFGFGKQKSQETFIEEELEHLMKRMDTMRSEAKTLTGQEDVVCMKKFFSVSALNIIWSLIAGSRFHHDDKQLQKLVQLMSEIVRLLAVGEDIIAAFPVLRHILPRFTKRGQERKKFLNEIHGMFKVDMTSSIFYIKYRHTEMRKAFFHIMISIITFILFHVIHVQTKSKSISITFYLQQNSTLLSVQIRQTGKLSSLP
jgi:hypothetical protein